MNLQIDWIVLSIPMVMWLPATPPFVTGRILLTELPILINLSFLHVSRGDPQILACAIISLGFSLREWSDPILGKSADFTKGFSPRECRWSHQRLKVKHYSNRHCLPFLIFAEGPKTSRLFFMFSPHEWIWSQTTKKVKLYLYRSLVLKIITRKVDENAT